MVPNQRILMVACCALAGAVLGVALYRFQPWSWLAMNPLGVLACACLGASGGCLWAEES